MKPRLILPTESGKGADLARQLGTILGTAARWASGTVAGAFLLALGDALSDVHTTITGAGDEAFATTATNLLDELETEYALPIQSTLTTEERRSRLTAKVRATRGGTDARILSAVRVLDPDAYLTGPTCVDADAVGNPRKTFYATLYCPNAWSDLTKRAAIQQLIDQMKPAHTLIRGGDGSPFEVTNATLGRLDRNGLG